MKGASIMFLFKLALKNLKRRKKRTFIMALILATAVISFLLLDSLMIGMMDLSFGNVIDFETPHLEIAQKEFFAEIDDDEEPPLEQAFIPEQSKLAELREIEGFRALTSVIDFSATFIAGRYDFPVLVRAIDEESFKAVFKHHEHLEKGEFISAGDSGVVIGKDLAEFFNLDIGDYYTLRFRDKDNYYSTLEGEIKGIISTPHPEVNQRTVLAARDQAVGRLAVAENSITQLMLRLENRDQALNKADLLAADFAETDFEVRSYRDASEMLVAIEAWGYLETYFILALILLVGAIGIVNAVVLSALERVEEIGMMKAMGLKEKEIVKVFVIEAGGIGVVGALLGSFLGGILNFFFVKYGFSLEGLWNPEALGLPLSGRLYGSWSLSSFSFIFIFVIIITVIASIIPAYWAARKDPADAIHHK